MSIQLTEQELSFLRHVGISENSVFDATNLPPSKYRTLMKDRSAIIAWGVTPCRAMGHRLRDSHGHCVMCHPASLSHAKRYHVDAYVYVAYSASTRLVKVGYSKDLNDRVRQMSLHKLGGANDWTIFESVLCNDAGRVEANVHNALAKYQYVTEYSAKEGICREVFRCLPRVAVKALRKAGEDLLLAVEH